jgi:hypothetical protein
MRSVQKGFKDSVQIKNLIDLSQYTEIRFPGVLPGNIFEESFEIFNKSNESLVVKVCAICNNPEFEDHDEYVFSVRKTTNYDYNDKHVVLIPPYKNVQFKVALKVPNTCLKTI